MLTAKLAAPVLRLPRLPPIRQWAASLVLATLAALYVIAGLSVTALPPSGDAARASLPKFSTLLSIPGLGTPPIPEPLRFRDVAPQDAVAINAAIPVSDTPNPAARAFRVDFATPGDRARALDCLTAAIYYEAAIEPTDGQRAVAQIVLNRVRHPAFPKSVCGVVFQGSDRSTGCQFTFTCDGALLRTPSAAGWARARVVADEALAGKIFAPVGWSTHYHTNWVVPYWSATLVKAAIVGSHIFYRWEGGWGRPPAFRFNSAGGEPEIAAMRRFASDPSSFAVDGNAADLAVAAAAGNPPVTAQGNIDNFQRAVLRRYEPMSPEAATAAAITRAAPGQTPGTISTLQWALSGLPQKPQMPLGSHGPGSAAAAPAASAREAPHCLDGVRRLPGVAAPPEKQGC
jgi:spore germination cell wall hydrolase CwlJ-like protein